MHRFNFSRYIKKIWRWGNNLTSCEIVEWERFSLFEKKKRIKKKERRSDTYHKEFLCKLLIAFLGNIRRWSKVYHCHSTCYMIHSEICFVSFVIDAFLLQAYLLQYQKKTKDKMKEKKE